MNRTSNPMRTLSRFWIGILLGATTALAQSTHEIGFVEKFALALDREQALRDLLPGTPDFFFYRALHAQNTGRLDEARKLLQEWKTAHRTDPRYEELEARQLVLEYDRGDPNALAGLVNKLRLQFNHVRRSPETQPRYPSRLDPAQVSQDRLVEWALSRCGAEDLSAFSDEGLYLLAGRPLSEPRQRELLRRLKRPDFPGLVDLVASDLARPNAEPFGTLEIHRNLTREQLDQLLQKRPLLRNEEAFVQTYLGKLVPTSEEDVVTDPVQRERYLERLWQFVSTLAPVHNSLKAAVLYHRLAHDRRMGIYNRERFLEYLKLPRAVPYAPAHAVERLPAAHLARLDATPNLPFLTPIGNDEPLVRDYLLYFLAEAQDFEAFRPWVRDDVLRRLFVEAKLVNGIGDPAKWAGWIPASEFEAIQTRVDLEFSPQNPDQFAPADPVRLTVFVKNITNLQVHVYRLHTVNYYRHTGRPLDLAVNLEGLVPTHSETHTYQDPPQRRVLRAFEFPQLQGRGAWVVECVGGGKSCRALIQKGRLAVVQTLSAAGHRLSVYDEQGQKVMNARAWLGQHEFSAGEDGDIVVPYTTEPTDATLVVGVDDFATLVRFQHLRESFEVRAGVYIERERTLPGAEVPVLIRATLLAHQQPLQIQVLEEPRAVLRATDLQGIVTEREYYPVQFDPDGQAVLLFRAPPDLQLLELRLQGRVTSRVTHGKLDLSTSARFALNTIDRTGASRQVLVRRTSDGYVLELRGKNGEPIPHASLSVALQPKGITRDYTDVFQTDEHGRVFLGPLEHIEAVKVTYTPPTDMLEASSRPELAQLRQTVHCPPGSQVEIPLPSDAWIGPQPVHAVAGQPLRLPLPVVRPLPRADHFSLLELRGGTFAADRSAALSIVEPFLELHGLEPGDYSLFWIPGGKEMLIRVAAGDHRDRCVISRHRALQLPPSSPLQLTVPEVRENEVVVRVLNPNPLVRVHVFATRFLPPFDLLTLLGPTYWPPLFQVPLPQPVSFYQSGRVLSDEMRYILDRRLAQRFPGNMLERPSLLLNPWALRTTEVQAPVLQAGTAYRPQTAPTADLAMEKGAATGVPMAEHYATLDFLQEPAPVFVNLTPDPDGWVRIPRDQLRGCSWVRIWAADPSQAVLRHVALPDAPVPTIDRRLAQALDPNQSFKEEKVVQILQPGQSVTLPITPYFRYELLDAISRAFRILVAAGARDLEPFEFITRWPKLTREEKLDYYSRYACHELNYFLRRKDPTFFEQVVRPYLQNKREKTFVDDWLLGRDLSPYRPLPSYRRLNLFEKILLANSLPAERAAVVGELRSLAELLPIDPSQEDFLFDCVLDAGFLGSEFAADSVLLAGLPRPRAAAQPTANGMVTAALAEEAQRAGGRARAGAVAPAAPGEMALRRAPEAAADRIETADAKDTAANREMRKRALQGEAERARQVDKTLAFFAAEPAAPPRPLFRAAPPPKELAEQQYFRQKPAYVTRDLCTTNRFWTELAHHAGGPFLSRYFLACTQSVNEALLALASLDLPFEPPKHSIQADAHQVRIEPAAPALLYVRRIHVAEPHPEQDQILVVENFFRLDDPWTFQGAERVDKYVTDEFLVGVPYGARIVLTNPTGQRRYIAVLYQLPAGAIPLNGSLHTKTHRLVLEPYSTRKMEYSFYFPQPGEFLHYPATVLENERCVARARTRTLKVVGSPTRADTESWIWIAHQGRPEEVLEFLRKANLHRLDLGEIAWRMKDPAFYRSAIEILEARKHFSPVLWSYALFHNDLPRVGAYLTAIGFGARCGPFVASRVLSVDASREDRYRHLEYDPLIHARAHPLQGRHQIFNPAFLEQYRSYLRYLCFKPALDDEDQLAIAYYLSLQDRVAESIQWFSRVKPDRITEKLQYDYLHAYLAMYQGNTEHAERLANAYQDHPVTRWRSRFRTLASQLAEIRGETRTQPADPEQRLQLLESLASQGPALQLTTEGTRIRLDYRNLRECTLRFYMVDIEALFSRSPFAVDATTDLAIIAPHHVLEVRLPQDRSTYAVEVPEKLQACNLLIEASSTGIRKVVLRYANTLVTEFIEAYGQLVVYHAATGKPVHSAYVKVYARMPNGEIKFYKDGYTDLRGRFDYASIQDPALTSAQKFAVLVLHDELGAAVREVPPPHR